MKVLRAISSPMRMQILTLLYNGGPLSYMEIMKGLRLSPDKDAGRFAYHLKKLLQANLIQTDSNNGNYVITDLGRLVVNMAQGVGEKVSRRRRMHVRTSHLTIEEFDRNKIVDSLVREAGVPLEMACHIAREAEERLLMFRTKYLTAPLIRELVNAILLEKGLEEYRHKLTRLGLPVYDVTKLVQTMGAHSMGVGAVYKVAGDRVMGEYALLNVLPPGHSGRPPLRNPPHRGHGLLDAENRRVSARPPLLPIQRHPILRGGHGRGAAATPKELRGRPTPVPQRRQDLGYGGFRRANAGLLQRISGALRRGEAEGRSESSPPPLHPRPKPLP